MYISYFFNFLPNFALRVCALYHQPFLFHGNGCRITYFLSLRVHDAHLWDAGTPPPGILRIDYSSRPYTYGVIFWPHRTAHRAWAPASL